MSLTPVRRSGAIRVMGAWVEQLGSIVTLSLLLLGTTSSRLRAQTASFSGTVLIDSTEKPLANAEILFTGLNRSVRSDSTGNFLFAGLPLGKHAVTVRLVGYQSITTDVTLTNGRPVSVDLLLKPISTKLKNVEVTAAAPYAAKLADFEERRRVGVGKFLTADYFEKNDGRPVSSFLVEKIAGLKILQLNGERFLSSTRGAGMTAAGKSPRGLTPPGQEPFKKYPRGCYMQVIVNGRVEFNGMANQEPFDVDRLNAKDIIGLEFYTTATTPLQYNGTRGPDSPSCGTVIIWTK